MIPQNDMQMRAMMAQRAMMQQQQNPQDALLQALGKQAMMGDMLKETANYKMKMLKLKMKYGTQPQQQQLMQPPRSPMPQQGPTQLIPYGGQ